MKQRDQRQYIRGIVQTRMAERFEPRRNAPTTQNFERMFAKHHREENIEKEIELKVEKEASLSVSQALEKAKSLTEGTVLSQESYHDILNQLEDKNRYPFTVSLVEHEIRIANKYQGAVNIIDEISGPQGGELSFPTEFPAGEIPSNESGTSEHDFPGTRRVEGKKAQVSANFEDIASPQERAEYQRLIDGEEYDAAWQLLKEVTQTAGEREGEIGNSLVDLTTEKWAANDQVSKTGEYNQKAFLTLEEIDAGMVPCREKK